MQKGRSTCMTQSAKPRLLLIAAEFPPRGGGGVVRVAKLVKYLAPLGWDVTVVCSDEPVGETEDQAMLHEVSGLASVVRIRGPLRQVGAAARRTVEARRSGRGGAWLWDAARAVARAAALPDRWIGWSIKVGRLSTSEIGHPDVILSSGPPHSAHLAARAQSRRLRVPFAMDLRDDWAGNPLFASSAPWRDPIDRRLERLTVRDAGAIVVVSEASRSIYAQRYPWAADRLHVIPNGYAPEDLPPATGQGSGRPPDGRVRFLHPGSLRYDRAGGEDLFESFGAAAGRDASLVLHLLGSVSPSNAARARQAIPGASLSIDGFVPHQEALRRMAGADALVVISSVSEAGAGTMTGKIFECLAVRRPILLLSPPGPAADLVRDSHAGVVADPRDPPSIQDAISEVAAIVRSGQFTGIEDDALGLFDRRRQAEGWSSLLHEMRTDTGTI